MKTWLSIQYQSVPGSRGIGMVDAIPITGIKGYAAPVGLLTLSVPSQ